MKKAIVFLVIFLLLAYIVSSIRTVYSLWSKRELISTAQHQLVQARKENIEIKNQLKVVQAPDFIENEARNKLFLTKPGEYTIFLPKIDIQKAEIQEKQLPNWQQWLQLFIY